MKKILLIALLAFGMSAKAQPFTLEHTYDSAATFNSTGGGELMIINFEVSGYHYVKYNKLGKCINIYDMNHTLNKTISLANVPTVSTGNLGDVLYLSEHLFNDDPKIEFMYCVSGVIGNGIFTGIYNEDGLLLFSDTAGPVVNATWAMQQWPIYNTPNGTKMILSYLNGQAKVFGLAGTLTVDIAKANNELINQSSLSVSNPYPNPNKNSTTIDYTLPAGINTGEIVFYNLQGAEVKRFKVDRTFSNLLISTSDIAAGTYYYQLQTNKENSGGRKMVVIK